MSPSSVQRNILDWVLSHSNADLCLKEDSLWGWHLQYASRIGCAWLGNTLYIFVVKFPINNFILTQYCKHVICSKCHTCIFAEILHSLLYLLWVFVSEWKCEQRGVVHANVSACTTSQSVGRDESPCGEDFQVQGNHLVSFLWAKHLNLLNSLHMYTCLSIN